MIYVMIHGGAHGAWCWERMASFVNAPMLAIDLPGRGRRPANPDEQSWKTFSDAAIQDIVSNDITDAVLVGHSMGGITLINLMAHIPERIRHVIFLACPIPADKQSIGDMMAREIQMTKGRRDSHKAIEDGVSNDSMAEMLYHDMSPADKVFCTERLVAESMSVYHEPVSHAGLHANLPRTYIKTLKDRALNLDQQALSIARLSAAHVLTIDTGHTPMLAAPSKLAALIAQAPLNRQYN